MPQYRGEYEDALQPFFDAMRHKLTANKHKGRRKWETVPVEKLLELMKKEVKELEEAIAGGNTIEMLLEAADIGNFAMMVAYVAVRRASKGDGSVMTKPPTKRRTKK